MDGQLEFHEATVRSVAAALLDSAEELMQLADRLDATVQHEGGRLAVLVRQWAQRTAGDASTLTSGADRYADCERAAADTLGRADT